MDKEKMDELIAALQAQRDELLQQANRQLAYIDGKIDALKELAGQGDKDNEARE